MSDAEPSLPADPSLPQLEVARDPELMREVFQRHLRPLGKKTYRIRECRISHARYRRATRCMLQYVLHLEEPGTGRELTQWVTGMMHAKAGRIRQEWERLGASEPERAIAGATSPAFEPYAYVPELEMLVQVFPYDHQLPGLPFLMGGPPPELEPLLLARFGEGEWRTEAWDIEPVRYRAELRATLRLTVRAREGGSGREEERRFYAKVYRKEEDGKRTYRVLRALWERDGRFAVGKPVAYLDGLQTLVQEEVLGISLHDMLVREEEATASSVRAAARALAALHLDNEVPVTRQRLPGEEITAMERRGETLRRACPWLELEIEEIVGAVVAGLEEEGPTAPIHGDLKPDCILLDSNRLALLDLDNFTEADPLLDVASILSKLAVLPLDSSFPRDRAREAARVFVEEYFVHVPKAWRERLPLRYAGAVLRRAAKIHKTQSQVPDWPDKVEALVWEAKASLAGELW